MTTLSNRRQDTKPAEELKQIPTLSQLKALKVTELLPDANTSRGAPMGRSTVRPAELILILQESSFTMYLTEVKLNSGGYDRGGAYWGLSGGSGSLFVAHTVVEIMGETQVYKDFYRGSRDKVKAEIREEFPFVRFYR